MPQPFRVITIGTSAGGPDALRRLLKHLPADFPAPVLIVMHIGSHYSILPKILECDSKLPVRHAVDSEPLEPGVVLVAPPDYHLLLEAGMTRLVKGAKENFARPAIDPLFRSAAVYYRENAVGVVLTGMLDDGTVGLQAIKAYGGVALVQDPSEADEPNMPRSALTHVDVDACLPLDELAERLIALAHDPATRAALPQPFWHTVETENRFDLRQKSEVREMEQIATPSTFTCPECSGSLWEVQGYKLPHFRCHTGHSFTAEGLSEMQDQVIEEAVWAAVRALHEKQMLMQRFAKSAENSARPAAAGEHEATAEMLARHADVLRKMVVRKESGA